MAVVLVGAPYDRDRLPVVLYNPDAANVVGTHHDQVRSGTLQQQMTETRKPDGFVTDASPRTPGG